MAHTPPPARPAPEDAARGVPATPHGGAPPEGGGPLRPGELVAARYRIVRRVGRGGMGEVYEALDLELRERVALKVLRADMTADRTASARFKREILLARKVTHPNVCRMFDLGVHAADGRATSFVTMELLEGETLAESLARSGPLSPAAALPLVRQVCAALDAAHKAGIVHRDLKSGNVIVVADRGSGAPRAVVTDFGLARASEGHGLQSVTATGAIVGTPDYMAPEQCGAGPITPAVDVFALGVLLFEMVTGHMPFQADSTLAALLKRLQSPPTNPRQLRPDLDPAWERAILRCLQRDPGERFASASDVLRALEGQRVPPTRPARPARHWLLGALILTGLAGFVALRGRHHTPPPVTPPSPPAPESAPARRTTVAVLGFRNLSGRPDVAWIAAALAEMLTTEVAASPNLRTLPSEEAARARRELALSAATTHTSATLARIRASLGADFIVAGSYVVATGAAGGAALRVDLHVQDTLRGEGVAAFSETGREGALLDLVGRAGRALRAALGGADLDARQLKTLRASVPANTQATRFYAEGLEALHAYDPAGARRLFERATQADPRFPLAWAELSEAWSALGYDGRAREAAARAFALSSSLPREERLLVEARHRRRTGDWQRAIDIYRSLTTFRPDDPRFGVDLVLAVTEAGRTEEALRTVAELRDQPGPVASDPRLDLAEVWALETMGDAPRVLTAADRAFTRATTRGASRMAADALASRAWAEQMVGEPGRALADYGQAEALFAQLGDRTGVAKVLRKRAAVYADRGELGRASEDLRRALALYDEVGQVFGRANTVGGLGVVERRLGRPRAARACFEAALAAYRQIGDRVNEAWALSSLADTWAGEGELERALTGYRSALALAREAGDMEQQATTLANLGDAFVAKGDLAAAETHLVEAQALFARIQDQASLAAVETSLGDVALEKDELAAAEQRYLAALSKRTSLQERLELAVLQERLARLRLEQGRPGEGAGLAREALEALLAAHQNAPAARTAATLAEAEAGAGRHDEARRLLAQARALGTGAAGVETRWALALGSARVTLSAGVSPPAQLRREVEAVVDDARRRHALRAELWARLSAAELQAATGPGDMAEDALRTLQAEASARGYQLVAARCARTLASRGR